MNRKFFIVIVLIGPLALLSCQKAAKLSAEQVKQAITTHIRDSMGAQNTFAVEDTLAGRTRQLTLDYVHDSVHETEDGRYYACVDFTEVPGDTLDLDFYVTVGSSGAPKISEVVIHKVNGESRL